MLTTKAPILIHDEDVSCYDQGYNDKHRQVSYFFFHCYVLLLTENTFTCFIQDTHTLLNLLFTQDSQPMKMQMYLTWQRLMAGSEPLIEEADPHIMKVTVELGCQVRWSKKRNEELSKVVRCLQRTCKKFPPHSTNQTAD